MKKVIAIVLLLIVLAGGGYLGYTMIQKAELEKAIEAQSAAGSVPVSFGVMKKVETPQDALDAIDFSKSENKDTVAWLMVPGTDINNSVLQSHDNFYYLRRNEKKEDDVYGCYFADYENSFGTRDDLSQNTIIYGHSDLKDNPDGPKFSQLFRFQDKDFAVANPNITLFMPEEEPLLFEIFAVFPTDTNFDYISADMTEQEFALLLKEAKARSLYQYETRGGVTTKDKILTLSTCTVEYGDRIDQRFVVMAKLLPADAVRIAKTATLTAAENPKQPDFAS